MSFVSDKLSKWAPPARSSPRSGPTATPPLSPLLPAPAGAPTSGRLLFLDGLRALASLYVVLHHCCQIYQDTSTAPRYEYYSFIPWLLRGRAVAVFMVLSGFLLMMPVARSSTGQLPDGFYSYLRRRIRRIIPPYYIALALTLLCIGFVPGMNRGSGDFWGRAFPAFSIGGLSSHLLLLHGLSPGWAYKINPPLWTLATEWYLYLIFPTLLLPVWRKCGTTAMVLFAIAIGFAPRLLLHDSAWNLNWVAPWFIGLFAIGMAGAILQTAPETNRAATAFKTSLVGPLGTCALAVGFIFLWSSRMAMDYLFGLSTLWVILFCAQVTPTRARPIQPFLVRLLQSSFLRGIGAFSYSIYLTHGPVLMMIYRAVEHFHRSAATRALIMFVVAPPVAVMAAWLFYQAVERPLLPARAPNRASLAIVASPTEAQPARRVRPLRRRSGPRSSPITKQQSAV